MRSETVGKKWEKVGTEQIFNCLSLARGLHLAALGSPREVHRMHRPCYFPQAVAWRRRCKSVFSPEVAVKNTAILAASVPLASPAVTPVLHLTGVFGGLFFLIYPPMHAPLRVTPLQLRVHLVGSHTTGPTVAGAIWH